EVACKDYEINVLKSEFEKVKQEKEVIEFKIEKFDNASKSLNKLLESQITNKSKKVLGYNVVPPPHPLIYNQPKKLDLSYSGLDEFKDPEFKSYGYEDSKQESNIDDTGFIDSGCSRHMTGNIAYLSDFKDLMEVMLHLGKEHMVVEFLVGDEAVHKELGERMEKAATTASSLEEEQESGNINKTKSMATLNRSSP
ncbi:hypothetical protein Tco_1445567, partial [Tanacetum coccineum]